MLGSPRVARGVMGRGSGEGSLGVSSNETGHPIQVRLNTCSDQSQVQPGRQFPGTLVEVLLPAVCGQIKDPQALPGHCFQRDACGAVILFRAFAVIHGSPGSARKSRLP